ncbi:MAG: glycine oxidase ThiO [Mariprofundales bacterium]
MNIVIVGGGIIGCLTACRLRQRGVDVTLLEAGDVGHEASWAGAGILCPIHPWLYPDSFTNLVQHSLNLYPSLRDELLDQTDIDIELTLSGMLIPFFADEPHWNPALAWSQRFAWSVEQLDSHTAQMHEPTLAPAVLRALLWPQVAQLRNPRLLRAVHRWMKKLGVKVRVQTRVAQIETQNGTVSGVRLEDGERLAADRLLLAAGSWSSALLKPLGVELSIRPVKGQIVLLTTEPGTVRHIVKHDRVYLVPRVDGRVLVGATMEDVGFRGGNSVAAVHALLDGVVQMFPGLRECEIERQWMGFRPGSPDGLPFLGEVDTVDGLFVASGHYRNGVALAPVTASCMAAVMCGEKPSLDLLPFSPNRSVDLSSLLGYPT